MDTKPAEAEEKTKKPSATTHLSESVQGVISSTADKFRSGVDGLRELGGEGLVKVGIGVGAKAVDQATDREVIDSFWSEARQNPDIAGGRIEIPDSERIE